MTIRHQQTSGSSIVFVLCFVSLFLCMCSCIYRLLRGVVCVTQIVDDLLKLEARQGMF